MTYNQGSRLRRPSMLNTRYFRFGRKFRLSVGPLGRDFYIENISALEANFDRKRRYARNIYNTEYKLYILKLNGFERFPGKLFTSIIVKRDFMRDEILPKQPVSAGVVHQQIYSKRYISKESLISALKQSKQARTVNFRGRRTILNLRDSWYLTPESPSENNSCNKYSIGNATKELYLWNYPMNFYQTKSNRNYKYFSFKQYKYHICSLNKIIIQKKIHSNCTKMKLVDRSSAI